jgi:DUF971 family protein
MQSLPRDVMPLSYELDEDHRELRIEWSDGHVSVHPYAPLRRACPCAWCAGEGNIPGQLTAETQLSEEQTTMYELQMVGRYGLAPIWGDGHKTGIFTYEKLRGMCRCEECRAARGDSGGQHGQ